MTTARSIIERGWIVELSTKTEIQIDPGEFEKVVKAIETGGLAKVKQGVINPSFIVCIREDKKRRIEFIEDTKYDFIKRENGMKSLADILPPLGIYSKQIAI